MPLIYLDDFIHRLQSTRLLITTDDAEEVIFKYSTLRS
jgi:hypothetical protein